MHSSIVGLGALSLLAGCATPLPSNLPLPDSVRAKASSLASPGAKAGSIGEAEATLHLRAAGNLGMIWKYSFSQHFAVHSDGLSEDVATAVQVSGGNSPPTSIRTLSICGLITLKSESASGGAAGALVFLPSRSTTTALPVGGALPSSNREVATTLEIEAGTVCNPAPGSTIKYRLSGMWERSVVGPIGTLRRVQDFDEVTTCSAQALAADFQYLSALGATLTVTCAHQSITGRPTDSVFAYFPAGRRYALVYLGYGTSTYNRVEYKAVRYKE